MPAPIVPSPQQVDVVRALVTAVRADLLDLAHTLYAEPELAYAEHAAARRCAVLLARNGLEVTYPAYGVETAFVARAGHRGPHLVVCAEYDALPEVGHACGHNLIAAAGVGAGIALAALAEEAGLRVSVLGTPAEETGGGKVDLIRAGALEGVDAAMMVHPSSSDNYGPRALAIEEWRVTVHGRTSHASDSPELGRNALDGLVAGYTAIAMLRQHLRPHQQVHGIITHGGAAPNIVPDHTEALYYLRAADFADLDDLRERVRACLDGAATATGTTVAVTTESHVYEPLRPHPGLVQAFSASCAALGRPYEPRAGDEIGGSTDFGNVSQVVPGLHANMSLRCWPIVNHQAEFAAHTLTPDGETMLLDGAMAMALTGWLVAEHPDLLAAT